jgi:radical SAM protein with 4Fe4S-binding SPASM domain
VDGAQRMALNGIKNCLENDIDVRIFTTLIKHNFYKLPEFVEFIKKLGVGGISFFDLNPVGKGYDLDEETRLTVEEYKKSVQVISEINDSEDINLDILAPFNFHANSEYLNKMTLLSGGFCNAGISTLNISPGGYIQPCSRLRTDLGNAQISKIKEIWRESSILKQLRDRSKLKGTCGRCDYKYFCGGCRANAYSDYNDYLMEDLRCF